MALGDLYAKIEKLRSEESLSSSAAYVMRDWLKWLAANRLQLPSYVGQHNGTSGGVLVWVLTDPVVIQCVVPPDVNCDFISKGMVNRLLGCFVDLSSYTREGRNSPMLVLSIRFPRALQFLPKS